MIKTLIFVKCHKVSYHLSDTLGRHWFSAGPPPNTEPAMAQYLVLVGK